MYRYSTKTSVCVNKTEYRAGIHKPSSQLSYVDIFLDDPVL